MFFILETNLNKQVKKKTFQKVKSWEHSAIYEKAGILQCDACDDA